MSRLVAPVAGVSAAVLAALLRRRLESGVEAPPHVVAELRATLAGLEEAAGQWRAAQVAVAEDAAREAAAVAGSVAAAGPEAVAGSGLAVVTSDEAAALLGVSASRVRQRCRAGELGARQAAGRWWCDRDLVLADRSG